MVQAFGFEIPFQVICELLGLPTEVRDDFHKLGVARFDLAEDGAAGAFGAAAETRTFLIDQVRQQRVTPGDGLFGEIIADEPHAAPLPNVPEWTDKEKLAGEKELLGFWVTGHPLDRYEDKIAELANRYLELTPVAPTQFGKVAAIPERQIVPVVAEAEAAAPAAPIVKASTAAAPAKTPVKAVPPTKAQFVAEAKTRSLGTVDLAQLKAVKAGGRDVVVVVDGALLAHAQR